MKNDRYAVLKNKSYLWWLTSRVFANFGKNMLALIVAWQVYELTKKPLALGFIGLAEAIPFVGIGLWAGHAADRYEKRNQIVAAMIGLSVCSVALLTLSMSSKPSVLLIYMVMACTGFLSSFEFAASGSYVQTIVSAEDFPRASAWTLSQYQVTVISGPIMAGWVLATAGIKMAYGVTAVLFILSALVAMGLRKLPVLISVQRESWASIKEGLQFLRSRRLIVACMSLDMMVVFFGDVVAIFPVFAEMFKVGPIGLGVLRAAPAVGSLGLSLLEANRPFIKVNWRSFLWTVGGFGASIIMFGFAENFYWAVFFLILGGVADGISVIIRQSVYQAFTPDHLRGRVAAVGSIFIRLSNELGAFESGLAAQLLGAVPSVFFGGLMTMVIVAVMKFKYPRIEEDLESVRPAH